jgi:hypothetical protein
MFDYESFSHIIIGSILVSVFKKEYRSIRIIGYLIFVNTVSLGKG